MPSVLCFSLVPVLRCVTRERVEFSTLLIPPGIELLFSITLFIKRHDKKGRHYYLLCAEGTSYFLLALLDFLSRALPVLRQDLLVVKIMDLIIGGLSIVPLLCFAIWFFFAAQEELLYVIPGRLRKLTKYILISFIPLVAASNVTGAFVGISYRMVGGVIVIGFTDERARTLWGFFNILSLSLWVVLEAVASLLLLARLRKAIRHKKQREIMSATGKIHHFRGIVFINLGMVLSLAETLAGFAPQSFHLAIARRGTKSAGRILIILGLLKGWDFVEDIRFVLQEPPHPKRVSKFSFRQLFPSTRSTTGETQTSEHSRERVFVRHPRGRAPALHLRLSGFDVSPIMRTFRSSPRIPDSPEIHLVPQMSLEGPLFEPTMTRHLNSRNPYYGNLPFDAPISPVTPSTPWVVTGPTPRASFSTNNIAGTRPSTPALDERPNTPTHMRGNTMSSTFSHLQVEVMTLSESPPDPGFVLPIPSRSRTRRDFDLSLDDQMLTRGLARPARATDSRYAEESSSNQGPSKLNQDTPPRHISSVNEELDFPPLDPPRPRHLSWATESSDTSLAVISTATRLVRPNTIFSVSSPATRPSRAAISDAGHTR